MANLSSKLKRGALAAGLVGTMYACGNNPIEDPTFIYPKSLFGTYEMNWEEMEDTAELNEEAEGSWDMEILTLGSDEFPRFTTLKRHTFKRDPKYGLICDSWIESMFPPIELYMHTVCGNIIEDQFDEDGNLTEPAKADLLVAVDIYSAFTEDIEHLTFYMWGDRKQEEKQ